MITFLRSSLDNEIVCFLKVQLAEAINLQDKNLMAQLQETMRCVSRFDNRTCRKLLASIAEDYRYFVRYLIINAFPNAYICSLAGWEDLFFFLNCTLPNQVITPLLPHKVVKLSLLFANSLKKLGPEVSSGTDEVGLNQFMANVQL